MATLRTITAAAEVLTISELKTHCRVDHSAEDSILMGYQATAQQLIEEATGIPTGETRYVLGLQRFPDGADPILIPRPAFLTLEELRYTDDQGDATTLTTARPNSYAKPAQLVPAWGEAWPATYDEPNAVEVDFSADTPTEAVAIVKQMVRLLVGTWYEHREDVSTVSLSTLPSGFDRLARAIRFRSVPLIRFLEAH